MANTQYPRLAQACEDNSLQVTHEYLGKDEYGKSQYLVKVNGKRIEIIATWGDEPGYECLSFMLEMASIVREERALNHRFNIATASEDMQFFDEIHSKLRRVLTDEQIIDFTLLAYDDENNA